MSLLNSSATLRDAMEEALRRFAGNQALWVKGHFYTYTELGDLARAIAARITAGPSSKGRCAIYSDRSEIAYAGILGSVLAGLTYVPLNVRFSTARNLEILKQADVAAIICDPACAETLASFRDQLPSDLITVIPEPRNTHWLSASGQARLSARPVGANDLAYILFTSGTTGKPKGVAVTHENILTYLRTVAEKMNPQPDDRFLQLVDLTFDPSVHDLFSCWASGGTLYGVPEAMVAMAHRFIRDFKITRLTSVPSTAAILKAEGKLTEGSLPSVRHTIFGGQALPVEVAAAWQKAAPQSLVCNHYGPTETTIAVSEYIWDPRLENPVSGTVPIGHAFKGQTLRVVDEALRPVARGIVGELLVSGSQVTPGYWNNPQATEERYIRVPGSDATWYRTGDLVLEDGSYGLRYTGRADQQLKVRGFRVEGHEVESHVRLASGSGLVAVIGWPKNEFGLIMGTVAFVVAPQQSEQQIIEECRKRMPDYMVPSRIITVSELPLNANGKVDYAALGQSKALG